LAGSATGNVTKLSCASERMQAAERSQLHSLLSSDDFNRHRDVAMSIMFWSLPSGPIRWTLMQMRCRIVAVHRRWYRSLWVTTILALEGPTDLFVASHWLERPSNRFPFTLLVFSRADYSTSQVLTTCDVDFISTFTEDLLQKASMLLRPPVIGSMAMTSHAAVNSDTRSIHISS